MQHNRAELEGAAGGFSSALMFRVARWYYLDKLSQQEIAARLETHRSTVSRLLQMAKDQGIVRIEIIEPPEVATLSDQLAESLGLRRVVVVDESSARASSAGRTVERLVEPALRELERLKLEPGDVMGVSWGNSVWRIASAPTGLDLKGVQLVPVIGGLDEAEPQYQTNEIVRLLAEHTGGEVNFLHLPARLAPRLRRDLLQDSELASRLSMWDRLDVALVGIGTTADDVDSWPKLHRQEREYMQNAVGDVAARYFARDGSPVDLPGDDTLVGISRAQLANAKTVLAVAAGTAKAPAIVGAARAGMIDVLVTDSATAVAVREQIDAGRAD